MHKLEYCVGSPIKGNLNNNLFPDDGINGGKSKYSFKQLKYN